jgi:hypothetical protein
MKNELNQIIQNCNKSDEVVKKVEFTPSEAVTGILTFYLDVGQLPPFKAEAFVERQKDKNRELIDRLNKQGIISLWIPVRPNSDTRVEFLPISEQAIKYQAKLFDVELTDIDTSN